MAGKFAVYVTEYKLAVVDNEHIMYYNGTFEHEKVNH